MKIFALAMNEEGVWRPQILKSVARPARIWMWNNNLLLAKQVWLPQRPRWCCKIKTIHRCNKLFFLILFIDAWFAHKQDCPIGSYDFRLPLNLLLRYVLRGSEFQTLWGKPALTRSAPGALSSGRDNSLIGICFFKARVVRSMDIQRFWKAIP
jgi:hypothetical protein